MDEKRSGVMAFVGPAVLASLVAAVILRAEGMSGFFPFVNVEAFAIVVLGALGILWSIYPLREIFRPATPEAAEYAAECFSSMGVLGTVTGMILMLSSIDDVSQVPRRMALALTCLFFGLFFSEVIFRPMAGRLRRRAVQGGSKPRESGGQSGFWKGLAGLLTVVLMFFVVLYSLSAAF